MTVSRIHFQADELYVVVGPVYVDPIITEADPVAVDKDGIAVERVPLGLVFASKEKFYGAPGAHLFIIARHTTLAGEKSSVGEYT